MKTGLNAVHLHPLKSQFEKRLLHLFFEFYPPRIMSLNYRRMIGSYFLKTSSK